MAIEGKVRTLYTDKTQQEAIFPTTKVSAVTDDEGNGLNTLLEHIAYVDPMDMESAAVLANADLLGGYPASDYAFTEDLKNLKPEDIGAASMEYAKKMNTPRNLLDNSDFRNPVNQRGKTSYTGAGYTIDRWAAETSTVTVKVNDGFITLSNTTSYGGLVQKLEHYNRLKGKMATIAVNIDGAIYVQHFKIGEKAGGLRFGDTAITFFSVDNGHVLFRIDSNSSVNVYWAALYEGEYTIETLPEYHSKGYGVELSECQRYYQQELMSTYTVAGIFDGAGCLDVVIPLKTTMRTIPTVNCIAYASGVAQGDNTIRLAVENTDPQTVSCSYQWKSTNFICPRYINGSYAWKKAIVTLRYTATADL